MPRFHQLRGIQLSPWDTQIVTQRDAALHLTVLEGASLLPAEPPALLGTIHS